MKIQVTELPDLLVIENELFRDERGFFSELYNAKAFSRSGVPAVFVQENHSRSVRNVLRGLHYQIRHTQAKLVSVLSGVVYDVAVDLRKRSPAFGNWFGMRLSEENGKSLFIPEGFAHGFCVLTDRADVIYRCTDFYSPEDEAGIRWDDPELRIDWPLKVPIMSDKDKKYPLLKDVPLERLPSL